MTTRMPGLTASVNMLGDELEPCSMDPVTGFIRNGCCEAHIDDGGAHTVCAVMTAEFLEFSKAQGNDLSTPRPEFGFAGLKPGDRWCLCAARWRQAYEADKAPRVLLKATHREASTIVPHAALISHALDAN
jgi:uncharacterized protein (DUF2237 family)